MFSVYGVAGQLFRGSLEQLRQIGGVSAIARTNAIQPVVSDGQGPAWLATGSFNRAKPATPSDEAHRNALAAYAHTQQVLVTRHPLSQVGDLMTRAVFTLSITSTILEAWQMLAEHGIGQAPVINGSGVLVGLVSRAELMRPDRLPTPSSNALVWRILMGQSVSSIMWTPVPSVAADTDIRRVAGVLLDTGLPGLPVVDEMGFVTGFVARSDILRAVVTDPPLDLWG